MDNGQSQCDGIVMRFTSRAIEERIIAEVLEAVGGLNVLSETIRPIVKEILAQELPEALRNAMPDILFAIDAAVANSFSKQVPRSLR